MPWEIANKIQVTWFDCSGLEWSTVWGLAVFSEDSCLSLCQGGTSSSSPWTLLWILAACTLASPLGLGNQAEQPLPPARPPGRWARARSLSCSFSSLGIGARSPRKRDLVGPSQQEWPQQSCHVQCREPAAEAAPECVMQVVPGVGLHCLPVWVQALLIKLK